MQEPRKQKQVGRRSAFSFFSICGAQQNAAACCTKRLSCSSGHVQFQFTTNMPAAFTTLLYSLQPVAPGILFALAPNQHAIRFPSLPFALQHSLSFICPSSARQASKQASKQTPLFVYLCVYNRSRERTSERTGERSKARWR